MDKIKAILLAIIFCGMFSNSFAQTESPDKPRVLADFIVAVVGDKAILRSELEAELEQLKESGETVDENLRCIVFQELIKRKLMLYQAEVDSLPVSDEYVEDEINKRLSYFSAQMGGEKKLEEYLGKSLNEYRKEMRPKMKQQLLANAMEYRIAGDTKISPKEVAEYYESIPEDSIPLVKAEFEVGQIIIIPKASDIAKEYAYNNIENLRNEIVNKGASFERLAKNFSEDRYSAEREGSLGEFGRGDMVPEFERAAFKLQKDSISQIVETQFGYHIIKLVERRGETVIAKHILIRPKLTSFDIKESMEVADSIRNVFLSDSVSFCKLASTFSEDEHTKGACGMFSDPQTGASKISIEYLEHDMISEISKLKEGELSKPKLIDMPDGTKQIRMLYLKSEIPPHKANLKDDYPRIQFEATELKREKAMEDWVNERLSDIHVYIDKDYIKCDFIEEYQKYFDNKQ